MDDPHRRDLLPSPGSPADVPSAPAARARWASRSACAFRCRSASRLRQRHPDPRQGLLQRDDPLRIGLPDGERPDFRSPQGRAVASERIGDRPDVGTGADSQVEGGDAVCIRDDVERVDARAAQGHLDRDPLPVQAVGALTPDLDGRRRGNRELDLPAEVRERRLELGRRRRLVPVERLALGIAGRRPPREVDVREVALGETDEAPGHGSCPTGQQQQEPRGERIERAGVPRLRPRAGADAREHG